MMCQISLNYRIFAKIFNMKKTAFIILFLTMTVFCFSQDDWAGLSRYRADNGRVLESGELPEVVFMGNSITEYWAYYHPDFFSNHNFCGRGIGGQTSSQMLARFTAEDKTADVSAQGKLNADMNGSGMPDSEDVVLILKKIAKLI